MSTKEELYDQGDQLKEAGDFEQAIAKMLEAATLDETYALPHSAQAASSGTAAMVARRVTSKSRG